MRRHFFVVTLDLPDDFPDRVVHNYVETALKRWNTHSRDVDYFDGIKIPRFTVTKMQVDYFSDKDKNLRDVVQEIRTVSEVAIKWNKIWGNNGG